MNPIRHIRRFVGVLAGLTAAVLLATPAFARDVPNFPDAYPGRIVPTPVPASVPAQIKYRTIVAGGMPGWQITLIALGAALVAVAATLLLARIVAAHRAAPATSG